MNEASRVLVVAAHPDDEAIGCGGTIARYTTAGTEVGVIFFTDGIGARGDTTESDIAARNNAASQSADILGFNIIDAHCYPDNQLDSVPFLELVKKIEGVVEKFQPQVVFTHFPGDLNIDHSLVAKAALTACRPQPNCSVRNIYAFEVPSATGWSWNSTGAAFNPNTYNDIAPFWEKKLSAIKSYGPEIKEFPHARSIKAIESLGIWRGSSVGLKVAEAFVLERKIVRTPFDD